MSWAIDVTGSKSAVAKKVTEHTDKIAASPEGIEQNLTLAKAKLSALEKPSDPKAPVDPKAVAAQKLVVADLSAKLLLAKEEAKDVTLAKERILALVGSVDLDPDDPASPAWNAVQVNAQSSYNLSDKGIIHARMAFSVVRTRLAVD